LERAAVRNKIVSISALLYETSKSWKNHCLNYLKMIYFTVELQEVTHHVW